MNNQPWSKLMKKMIPLFFVLFVVLALSSCSTINNKMRDHYWAERNRMLQSRLPEGMSFEEVPLSTVLEEISKASGLVIKPWESEGDRKVTIDVSGMTVDEALKAVVRYVDGEGAVLIEQKYFLHHSWGQYWPWGYPPTR